MAEIFKINIEIREQQEKLLLKIPESTKVPVGSIVQWNIIGLDKHYNNPPLHWTKGLIFTLYFSDGSPFRWRRQFVQLQHDPRFFPYYSNKIVRLAEDIAYETGNYKYGVKVTDAESDETLFDEDPYLIVF